MATNITEAVSSFSTLLTNVPKWREQITGLNTYTDKKLEEFRLEYTRIVRQTRPRKAKTRSITSIHSDHIPVQSTPEPPSTIPSSPDPMEFSPLEASNRCINAQATKKRRTGTSIRSGASGPLKFRSRQKVVVYYDSHVQDQLTDIVKDIGGCRNILRKGRIAYTISKGLKLPSLRRGTEHSSASTPPPIQTAIKTQSTPKLPTTKEQPIISVLSLSGEAAFLEADKQLEICQNVCETAAHQFLRDGDCREELVSVLGSLIGLLDHAQSTYDGLKQEEAEVKDVEAKEAETIETVRSNSCSNSVNTTSDSTLVEKASREYLTFGRKNGFNIDSDASSLSKERPPLSSVASAPPLMTEIEVDDDSDAESIEIDITQYRFNRTPRVQT